MHVCFIEDTQLRGGTQIWVSEAIRHLHAHDVEVTLLCPAQGFNASDARETDARIMTYDYDRIVGQDSRGQSIWTEALAPAQIAVCTVHPPRQGFHCSVFAAHCIHKAGLKTVLVPKTGTIVADYERRFYIPEEPIHSHIIAIAKFTHDYLVNDYGVAKDRVSLVYQGTEVDRYTRSPSRLEAARERYRLPEGAAPVLGCFGSFEERKGQSLLLDAITALRLRLPEIHLLLLGEGPDQAMLQERVAAEGLQKHVSILPFTSEPEYAFEILDILVLPSLYKEGLPNVVLESMSMEVPVVASRLAGTPEAVIDGETGFLVEPGSADQIADAVVRLYSDPATHRRIAAAGRKLITTRFDKKLQFQRFLEAYHRIAESTPRD